MEWNLIDDGPATVRPAYRLIEEFDEMLDIDDEPFDMPIEVVEGDDTDDDELEPAAARASVA